MKNFQPQQKVVFSTAKTRTPREVFETAFPDYVLPAENEIVTIVKRGSTEGYWIIREHLLSRKGTLQSFSELTLFPIKEHGDKITEKLLADFDKKIHLPVPSLT